MSHPNKDADRSWTSPISHPFFGQPSTILSFSPAPQPILNQKLIPRDFLGARSKRSPDTVSKPESAAPTVLFPVDPFQNDKHTKSNRTKSTQDRSKGDAISPTRHLTLENDSLEDNDLTVRQTRSSESIDPLYSTTKQRSASYGCPALVYADPFTNINMPRTSSIDSAISNVSVTSLNKTAGDIREPSPTSVRNLIATAGGAENLVTHLLKDKNNVASQNAQLWKLVEKQRALIFGLNKDLERITKERDRYKKKVKELSAHTISEDGEIPHHTSSVSSQHNASLTQIPILEDVSQQSIALNKDARPGMPSNSIQNEVLAHAQLGQDDRDKENVTALQAFQPITPEPYMPQNPGSPASSVKEPKPGTPVIASPVLSLVESSPLSEKPGKTLPSSRKAPPKPLNLAQGREDAIVSTQISRNVELGNADENSDRGRRRTREEDDRDREISAKKAEAEARSRSKKNKTPQPIPIEENQTSVPTHIPAPLPTPGLPLSPRPLHAQQTFIAPSVHLTAASAPQNLSLNERLLATPLKSPGLPLSPRPLIRNDTATIANSLPLSPRINMANFPLSPRAPKHALPVPTNPAAPTDAAALQNTQSKSHQPSPQPSIAALADRLHVHQPVGSEPPPVYRGLAISAYPNLLLPPNALPSIKVQVHSSRLRPSRHGVVGVKNQEEATVFSLSVISRSSNSELWRVEKIPAALPQLEQQLRLSCTNLPRMPDRRLFAGQSPALLDERRIAIDTYFDELLDIHIDEQAAISICRFLSTDVIDPEQQSKSAPASTLDLSMHKSTRSGPLTKTGYLTKKGKNFGGWKSRFFILDSTDFRYYEAAGGPHLGTIRLQNALIGKQKESDSAEDGEGQFRHAFLIQEPKRKDSGIYIRHVLCAESDAERDDWVKALVYWVEGGTTSRNGSRSEETVNDLSSIDTRYQNSRAGPSSKDGKDSHPNTPTPTSGSSIDSSIMDHVNSLKQTNISGPMNGGVITDNSTWGYRQPATNGIKDAKDKTHKMSNIFGFKKPDPAVIQQEPKPVKPRILRHNGYVRPVFGLPLAEAVEFCSPFNVEVDLPAVVYRSIEYLRYRNAANEEGLFRLSGSNVVVRNLKDRFNTEGDVDLVSEDEYHDIHAVTSLFKTYLRELPSTLLTRELHIEFIKVLEMDNLADRVVAFNTLVHMLPRQNFALLKEMSKYLVEVVRNADKNKMSIRNVGIVFSPTLNIPTPVFNLFLTEYTAIFETDSTERSNIKTTEIKAPLELTPEDIRSPRHQMFTDLPTPAYHQTTFHTQAAGLPTRGTMTGTGELGFMPIQGGYDSSHYVSGPRNPPAFQAKPLTQVADMGGFNSLNSLLAPVDAPSDRARKRQSQIYAAPPEI